MGELQVVYRISPAVTNEALNMLFADAWPDHQWRDFTAVLNKSLGYICAYQVDKLVGFVNVAWDGATHAFLLDTTVLSDTQRRRIGSELVRRAEALARQAGAEWLHVDYEANLEKFYKQCGFRKTEAGLIRLTE